VKITANGIIPYKDLKQDLTCFLPPDPIDDVLFGFFLDVAKFPKWSSALASSSS